MHNTMEQLEARIRAGAYAEGTKEEWGGADVVFTKDADRPCRESDLKVVTPYAGQIARLIDDLKPHLTYDYLSKYICYRQMGEAVIACGENAGETEVLLAALHAAAAFVK